MKRAALALLVAAAGAGCVSVESLPDVRGALKPGQRLVVVVYPPPGPWIVDAADTKGETAAKLSPLGFLMQTAENEHTLGVSKDYQQYLPRPRYHLEVQEPLLKALREASPGHAVQTGLEAGLVPAQLLAWNEAKDQLDWRLRYYAPDPSAPAPRDYARALTLDDALILDVNLSYGTSAPDEGPIRPSIAAASRVYRGDTSRLIWEHEDELVDTTSSATLVEFKIDPAGLTGRIETLAPLLGGRIAASFLKAFSLAPSTSAPSIPPGTIQTARSGLLPLSMLQGLTSGTTAASTVPVAASTAPVAAPPAVANSTSPPVATPASSAPAVPPSLSTPTTPSNR